MRCRQFNIFFSVLAHADQVTLCDSALIKQAIPKVSWPQEVDMGPSYSFTYHTYLLHTSAAHMNFHCTVRDALIHVSCLRWRLSPAHLINFKGASLNDVNTVVHPHPHSFTSHQFAISCSCVCAYEWRSTQRRRISHDAKRNGICEVVYISSGSSSAVRLPSFIIKHTRSLLNVKELH